MKKLALLSAIAPFLTASATLAATPIPTIPPIVVNPPTRPNPEGSPLPLGYSNLGSFISNVLVLAFGIAILVVLIMLVWGAFEWITSGGDKEAVGKARGRIINALIGLGVIAVAYALAVVASQFLGFADLKQIPIPAPQ